MSDQSSLFVRSATQDDLRTVNEHAEASRAEASKYRGTVQQQSSDVLSLVFVAGIGTTIMGSAATQIDGNKANIVNIYVEPDAREIGIGDALLSQLIDELRRREITYVNAQALPGDRATKNLFERHGLIAQTIIVGKPL